MRDTRHPRSSLAVAVAVLLLTALRPCALIAQTGSAARIPNRTAPAFAKPSPRLVFSAQPTTSEIAQARIFEELLVPVGAGEPAAEENRMLADALLAIEKTRLGAACPDLGAAEQFLQRFPNSAWAPALWSNLGIEYYRRGSFSKCVGAWQRAWDLAKSAQDPRAAAVADHAVAELARMHARLGHAGDLERIFAEVGSRSLSGSSAVTLADARDGLWNMKHRPGISFKCGPFALDSIIAAQKPADASRTLLREVASTADGTSLAFLVELAAKIKLDAKAAFRTAAGPIPVPSVVHWKLGHYGALLRAENGRYLLRDPTFGTTEWIDQAVLDEEASGYFLLTGAGANLAAGWREVSGAEAAGVWGKGLTTTTDPHGTGPKDPKKPNPCPPAGGDPGGTTGDPGDSPGTDPGGMAQWSVHLMLVSLNLQDTPLQYTPPFGPRIAFALTYDMLEANQPGTLSFSNFGSCWNFNWVSTLTFDSNNAYLASGQGGTQVFTNFAFNSIVSALDPQTHSYIFRTAPSVYEQRFPNGAKCVFGLTDPYGRAYQTQIVDPQGNAVALGYDAQYRLITITDAIGQISVLSYDLPGTPFQITRITDPFGRSAQFGYDGSARLIQITDAQGLTSAFTYGAGSSIQTLATGYGTTSFNFTDNGDNNRNLVVSNPDGSQEMFTSGMAPASYPQSEAAVPQGMSVFNEFLQYRNTFHWDRKAMAEAPGDYSQATVYHFLHSIDTNATGRLLESVKRPLENRVWMFYQGQTFPGLMNDGMLDNPTFVGRVLDDGSTQLRQSQYDAAGNLTQSTDPLGRSSRLAYAGNTVDLLSISQATSPVTGDLLFSLTYNNQHRPLTVTDAAGQTTTYTYNAVGQVLTSVDPKQETTTYTYDANGYLLSVAGPFSPLAGRVALTYDAVGRVATVTDALGYVLTYGHDNLNRLTSITYPDLTSDVLTYTLLDVTNYQDRLRRNTVFGYNSMDQLVSVTDPLNRVTQYAYCRCGALSSLTDPLGRVTRWKYDVQGRKIARIFPDATQTTYSYEQTTSRLHAVTDSLGQVTYYQYNTDDSLGTVSYAQASITTPGVTFRYDSIYPRITSMVDRAGTTGYQYYPVGAPPALGAGKLSSLSTALGLVEYGYDELGRLASRAVNGVSETVGFDALSRPASVTNALGLFTYGYIGDSELLTSVGFPDGQNSTLSYLGNQADHRLGQIQNNRADGSNLSQWTYAYNAVGQITSLTQQRDDAVPRVLTPGYDAADQLTGAALTNPNASYGYTYDSAGNRLTATVNAAPTNVSYSPLNEIQTASPSGESDRTYEWDAAHRLAAINYGGTNRRTELACDGVGRLIKITEKADGSVTCVKQFLWDDLEMVAEFDGNGNLSKRFFEQGAQILTGNSAGIYFYAKDHLGSVCELTDASGALRARYDYTPFGQPAKTSGDLDADFLFTGYYYHAPSGLYLAPFRAYDPNLGRWISRDPLEESGGDANLYLYVRNQPLTLADRSGFEPDYREKLLRDEADARDDLLEAQDEVKVANRRIYTIQEQIAALPANCPAGNRNDLFKQLAAARSRKALAERSVNDLKKRISDLDTQLANLGVKAEPPPPHPPHFGF